MKEYVEATLRSLVDDFNNGSADVWNMSQGEPVSAPLWKTADKHHGDSVWSRHMNHYRSHNGLYMVHEIKDNVSLDMVTEYLRDFGHCVAVDRANKVLYADGQAVIVGTAEQKSSLVRKDDYLVVNLSIQLPVMAQKAVAYRKFVHAQNARENKQLKR